HRWCVSLSDIGQAPAVMKLPITVLMAGWLILGFGWLVWADSERLSKDDVLSIRDGQFFLDGKRFAEISFNKFDLFWQLYDQLAAGKSLEAANPMVQAQERALRNLHELGFRTIRIFALPWGPEGPASYAQPEKRQRLYAALDKTLELCDAHQLRVDW